MVQYKKFQLDSLFDIQKVRGINKSGLTQPSNGECYDYITRTSKNNGIESHTGLVESRELNEAGTFSLGLLQMTFFYRDKPWYAGQFVRKIVPKRLMTKEQLLYFLGIFQALRPLLSSVLVRKIDETFSNAKIELPVTPAGEPDFEYMTMRIRELEAERIRELEAYLRVTGLNDTTLSTSEAQVLTKQVKWKKFKVGDVFDIRKGRRLTKANQLSGNTPFIGSSATDHGVTGHIGQDPIFEGRTLTVSYNGSVGQVFYQTDPYWASDDINVLSLKNKDVELTPEIGNYLATCLTMAGKGFGYNRKWNVARMTETAIELPVTADDDIDFDYMQNYIRATEKRTVKGVVEYKDRVIEETKKVVGE